MNFNLYYAALAADDAYQTELVRVYGKQACNKRYSLRHDDIRVIAAGSLKRVADEEWLAEMRGETCVTK